MDAAQFLSRIIAPGNYLALAFKKAGTDRLAHRFFARSEVGQAASFAAWCAGQKMDVWHACASYTVADVSGSNQDGSPKYKGSRTQENAQALKCFWYDADVKRDGDGKKDGKAYDSELEAVQYLRTLSQTTGLPFPNVWLKSGYGLHFYWVFEDALPTAQWTPYAAAFKAMLLQTGAKGDIGLTNDSARLLRPPQTLNYKVPASPVPVFVSSPDQIRIKGDYPNEALFAILQPYMSTVSVHAATTVVGGTALDGGAPLAIFAARQASLVAAAQANMPAAARRDHHFSMIASKCGQVKQSLAEHGLQDDRTIWLDMIRLAHFCVDGAHYAHEIGSAHPSYSAADTDREIALCASEQQRKNFGATLCATMDANRAGICSGCPHASRIKSPLSLGVEEEDLPHGYRRRTGLIERATEGGEEGVKWMPMISGDVYDPKLDRIGAFYRLTFTYERANGQATTVVADDPRISFETSKLKTQFGEQGITLNRSNAIPFGDFCVAWIEKLRDLCAIREHSTRPFGWVIDAKDNYVGFAVGGTIYKQDGTQEPAPGGDLAARYQPHGLLSKWQAACEFVAKGRPDLQIIIGASFGAPLMEFTGEPGSCMSVWSRDSGVGKSSAFKVGTTVWGDWKTMSSLNDTENATLQAIGQTRVMPAYWDEIDVTKDRVAGIVNTLFTLAQGRGKARLTSETKFREVGDWRTILVASGNKPLMDFVIQERGYSDAGALRVFEIVINQPGVPHNPAAGRIISQVERNYGMAGRAYAEWLGRHGNQALDMVQKMIAHIANTVKAETGERFYIAGMACILTGAAIASKHLGFGPFDLQAMFQYLVDTLLSLRAARHKAVPTHSQLAHILHVLNDFLADNIEGRLVSNFFQSAGRRSKTFKIEFAPGPNCHRLATHTGIAERVMRVDRTVWNKWCMTRSLAPTDLVGQMKQRWKAVESRGVLGAGTTLQIRADFIEIPLVDPELQHHVNDFDPAAAPGTATN